MLLYKIEDNSRFFTISVEDVIEESDELIFTISMFGTLDGDTDSQYLSEIVLFEAEVECVANLRINEVFEDRLSINVRYRDLEILSKNVDVHLKSNLRMKLELQDEIINEIKSLIDSTVLSSDRSISVNLERDEDE